jgi:hypothetical protein
VPIELHKVARVLRQALKPQSIRENNNQLMGRSRLQHYWRLIYLIDNNTIDDA